MHTCDLIDSSHLECCGSIGMQVLDENSEVFYNFINMLHSDSTKESYRFCLEKFLNHYGIDLLSGILCALYFVISRFAKSKW